MHHMSLKVRIRGGAQGTTDHQVMSAVAGRGELKEPWSPGSRGVLRSWALASASCQPHTAPLCFRKV